MFHALEFEIWHFSLKYMYRYVAHHIMNNC